jgi:uncharacterized protein
VLKTALYGLPVGLAFGYALQRGRFCMNTAFRDIFLIRDLTLLRAYLLAVLIQLVGVQLLVQQGWLDPAVAPFWWQAALVGGFVFGWGMALSGG